MHTWKTAVPVAVFGAALLTGTPAVAAQGEPTLKAATVDVVPAAGSLSADVTEVVSLDNVERGSAIENTMPVLDGAEVGGLNVTVDGQEVDLDRQRGADVEKLSFSAPASGKLRYEVRYQVAGRDGEARVPLAVPGYTGAGEKAVKIRYRVPEGYYLQPDAFPATSGSTGTLERELSGMPTFIDYEIGRSEPSVMNVSNVAGGAVLVLIAALTVLVFLREARPSEGGAARV
ncbi:MAG: hypothetical protein ACRDPK_07470 [Carbonactinosporaceae bacterium]